ncbi:fibroblast growth factor receptor 1-like isoform X1, partial [Aphis craccivora]
MTLEDETSNVPAVNQTEINSTAPKFKDLNSVDRVMVGYERNTIKLKCEAEANPLLNISWYKDGVTPPRRQWGVIIYSQRSIILHNLTMEDSGSYKCKVINENGFIDFTYKVEVKQKFPGMVYIKEGNNITALVHTNATFDCNVEADQKPCIEWLYHNTSFKNVNDTNLDDGIIIKDSNSSSNEFIIAELLKLIDVTHLNEGWYTCKAILKNDTVYASAYLKVINMYHTITMVIIYELIILACVIMIVHRQKKKKELMARQSDGNERITQWTKKIIIEKLQITDVNELLILHIF